MKEKAPPPPSEPPSPSAGTEGAVDAALTAAGAEGLSFVMDVPLELSVEVGRKTMRLADVLKLSAGSVLELDQAKGSPLQIFANNRLVARGEAVVVGERYGVRVTDVLVSEEPGRPR